jgi:hypothetical protein
MQRHPRVRLSIKVGACLFISLMLAAIIVPNFVRARYQPATNACLNNVRQIQSAKDSWANEHGITDGSIVPTEADLSQYLRGDEFPYCPIGGASKYEINPIGEDPACSEPIHDWAIEPR